MKVRLKKKWRGHKKGTALTVLGGDLAVRRDGFVRDRNTGKKHLGPVVDPEQALQMREAGYLADAVEGAN